MSWPKRFSFIAALWSEWESYPTRLLPLLILCVARYDPITKKLLYNERLAAEKHIILMLSLAKS